MTYSRITMPEARLAGALVIDQRELLKSVMLDEERYRAALATLPDQVRDAYDQALSISWVPTTVVDRVITACAREAGREPLDFHAELTRINVERTLKGLWRVILRFTGDQALVSRSQLIYRKTFDTGTIEGTIPEPGHSMSILRGWPEISDIHLVGLEMGVQTTLRCAGRQNVRSRRERTPEGGIIECFWTR